MKRIFLMALAGAVLALPGAALSAGAKVGETVRVDTLVSGQGGALAPGDAIHRAERIRSNASGNGSFIFDDGTKLAIGPNASVVIDEYVYDGGKTVKKLAVTAAKGTFRWISGKSPSSAYRIETPSGTLGVRGTAFDFFVGANGVTAVVLLNGSAEFCTASSCQRLTRRCEYLIARRDGEITKPRGVVRQLADGRNGAQTFPFLAGLESLPRGFKASSSCEGLSAVGNTGGGRGSTERPDKRGLPAGSLGPEQRSSPPRNGGDSPNDNNPDNRG